MTDRPTRGLPRRTQAERRAQTRARLLGAAREVFGRQGYRDARLDDVAREAGVSKGALYHHFAGKEELFLALIDERLAERVRELERAFEAPAHSGERTAQRLARSSRDALAVAKKSGEWRLLFFEFASHAAREPKLRAELAARRAQLRDPLAAIIEKQSQALGRRLALEPAQIALVINALANGLAVEALLAPDEVPAELLGQVLGFMFRGMASEADTASRRVE